MPEFQSSDIEPEALFVLREELETADITGSPSAIDPIARIRHVVEALEHCSTDIAFLDRLSNAEAQEFHELVAQAHRLLGVQMALSINQIDQRSAVELAGEGMARQSGDRTAIEMAKNLGGLTQQQVMDGFHSGRMMRELQSAPADPDITDSDNQPEGDGQPVEPRPPLALPAPESVPTEPWLRVVSQALRVNELSPALASAIRSGLGTPTEGVPVDLLATAAAELVAEGRYQTPDRMLKLARKMRARLDRSGVALREAERRARCSARVFIRSDGMVQVNITLDPERGMQIKTIADRITSPKLNGPTTADPEIARRIENDPRKPDQLLADELVHLIQVGAVADPSNMLATPTSSLVVISRRAPTEKAAGGADGAQPDATIIAPAVDEPSRNSEADMEHLEEGRHDIGWIEGHPDPVSPETVDRLACTGAIHEASFDHDGHPLDVSREQRLFGRKQRIALGAVFGGCTFTDKHGNRICDRPPSWTEAHHIERWTREDGKTVMANGILLCKLHHLEVHRDKWKIERDGDTYWLTPPEKVDPSQTPRRIRIHSDAYRDLMNDDPSA